MKVFRNYGIFSLIFLKAVLVMRSNGQDPQQQPPQTKDVTITENLHHQPFRVITVAVPNDALAKKFARELVLQGLAAIVNIFPSAASIYIWKGVLQEVPEIILFIYTHVSQYEKIEKYIRANHIHVEPGVVALPVVGGSKIYLDWLESQRRNQSENVQSQSVPTTQV